MIEIFISADKQYYKYKMIVHQYEKSYKGDSELDDYFRFKMASSANLRKSQDGISNLGYVFSATIKRFQLLLGNI